MQRTQTILRARRCRLMARASPLAMRVALRPRNWAPGLLAVCLIGAAAPVLAQEAIDLEGDADLIIQGAAAGDYAGYSVSGAGDLNGDGIDDLIIGAPRADPNGPDSGASYLVFGTQQSLPPTIDLASDAHVVIEGAAALDLSGFSVSGAGDLNGDGIDDLIIGAIGADPNGQDEAGASYLVFGTDQGFPATIDLASDADVVIQGVAAFDQAGRSVGGAGDVDGDGIDDLIIGAPFADPNGTYSGASYVVFGTDQGLPAAIDLADVAQGIGGFVLNGAEGDRSGFSVSGAGDFDGDGLADLIIGAPGASPNGRNEAGASYVVFGTDQGFPSAIDLADDADLIIMGASAGDILGWSVRGAGDVDGDGTDDLIVGAIGADPNGRDSAGASFVIFGSDQVFPATIDLASGPHLIIMGATAGDQSGWSVSGGDIDGDGFADMIIGAITADPDGRNEAGATYAVLGSGQNFPATIDLASDADLIIQGGMALDFSGGSVSGTGDVNGDGIADLTVGAGGADPNGRAFAGTSYVVFGGPAAATKRLIARIEAAGLPGGIENALTKKLSNALGSLARGKANGAIAKVGAFINQVEAQRGKHIQETDADAWIIAAETILDMLSAS